MIDHSTFGTRTALFHTFGCKLNFAETSTVATMLAEHGVRRATAGEQPDFIVVNTCSVTELADKKCRQTIRSLHRRHPSAAIVVTGCYAQLKSEEVAALPGVQIVAGMDRKLEIANFVDQWSATHTPQTLVRPSRDIRDFSPSCSRGDRTRYFLKVQDGCDYWCSYCTIPAARGRSRSGTIDQMLEQARAVAESGGKEIVITGVNIGDFGKGRDDNFLDLCRALDTVDGIERYRISSIEPNLLTDEIIDFVASSRRFMPHFHVPLQSGDDEVLRLMRRHYDTALFRRKMERIKQAMPHAFVGVDLIVGARGETEERFARSRDFVASLPVSRLHVFTYSERPG
ncbi:MAG: MiaB/RimO family radical SAM methylthiotransferase, partial [Muribaculaceae bacterium]|nr:MiaB/RimO family radical SAM methylthiotransferase [Muribaculaceae bacterium]